jgi:hypothetical protein
MFFGRARSLRNIIDYVRRLNQKTEEHKVGPLCSSATGWPEEHKFL